MLLKLKAKLYQYTGIYLGRKEEKEYMATADAIKQVEELIDVGGYSGPLAHGVITATWQAKVGFTNIHTGIWVPSYGKWYRRLYYRVLNRVKTIYLQFKEDLGFNE